METEKSRIFSFHSFFDSPTSKFGMANFGIRCEIKYVCVCVSVYVYIYIYWGGLKRRINEKMPLKVSRVSRSLGDVTYRATYEVKKKRKRRCLSRARLAVVTCFTSFINFSVEPTLIAPTIVFRIPGHF